MQSNAVNQMKCNCNRIASNTNMHTATTAKRDENRIGKIVMEANNKNSHAYNVPNEHFK